MYIRVASTLRDNTAVALIRQAMFKTIHLAMYAVIRSLRVKFIMLPFRALVHAD